MQQLPIVLYARKGNWQRFSARRRNARFLAVQPKIFQRDAYTCRYCGFQCKKYLEVVNHDNDYGNNKAQNLVTACMFCAQCFFLENVGKNDVTGGYIIYLPEITQADLNHFCRVMFASMLRDAPYRGKLHTTYLSFKDRGKIVDELFGPNSSDPDVFGQSLIDSGLGKEVLENQLFKNLRLLPERKPFSEQINYWKNEIFDKIPL